MHTIIDYYAGSTRVLRERRPSNAELDVRAIGRTARVYGADSVYAKRPGERPLRLEASTHTVRDMTQSQPLII